MKTIIKRNGVEAPFNKDNISNAIFKAAQAVGGSNKEIANSLADKGVNVLDKEGVTTNTVDHVQDVVEKVLIEEGHAATAKAYILYRKERDDKRNMTNSLIKSFEEITFSSSIQSDMKRENANIDADTAMGTMLKYGSEGANYFVDNYILPKDIAAAHINGDIHIHDKDFYMLTETCCQTDLIKLFEGGFSTGHGFIRKPKSIASYASLACIAIQANQNEMHGGQSVPNFDYAMAEGVACTFR